MTPSPSPEPLAPFVETLDGALEDDQELWLDEKNKNISINMQNYRECRIDKQVLVDYINNLPE